MADCNWMIDTANKEGLLDGTKGRKVRIKTCIREVIKIS